jgi:16S rRNA (guanine966-N2)-methyltransferase
MENRRPPRSNSSGRKSYFDRSRGAPGYRDGKPTGQGPGRPARKPPRADGRYQDGTARPGGPKRRDARPSGEFGRGDGNRIGYSRYPGRNDGRRGPRTEKGVPREPLIRITSDAQITDGKLRGKTLQNSVSPNSIPTKRKIREIAFKILSRRVKAARVLDLGAGPGTIGLEAISRGAMLATFVERSARMCTFIRKNLAEFGVKDGHGEVVEMEILPFLIRCARRKRAWDIVYFDVPDSDEHRAIVDHLGRGCGINTGGLLLIEHKSETQYPESIRTLKRWRTVDQGETIVTIYERI